MLVLTRRTNERVIITLPDGATIQILLCEVRGDKVRIGFEAPRQIKINRLEVQESIDRDGERVAHVRS